MERKLTLRIDAGSPEQTVPYCNARAVPPETLRLRAGLTSFSGWEYSNQLLRRNGPVALLDPRLDQIQRLLILQMCRDPATLAEAVAGRLRKRQIHGHIA